VSIIYEVDEDALQDGTPDRVVEEAISAIRETGSYRFQLSTGCGTSKNALAGIPAIQTECSRIDGRGKIPPANHVPELFVPQLHR
jgi:hypothetical protein